jgi:hypothetical protein
LEIDGAPSAKAKGHKKEVAWKERKTRPKPEIIKDRKNKIGRL